MSAQAADWVGACKALHKWCWQATGIDASRVRVPTDRDYGEARGPAPKATITVLSCLPISQVSRKILPQIMIQRYKVTAVGPGEVGVDFYPDTSLTPQRISIIAGPGDPTEVSAAALLAELTANLPLGYTAALDPSDTSAVLVSGSAAQPMFAARPADDALLAVTTPMPRYPYLNVEEHRVIWRVLFRSGTVSPAPSEAAELTGPRFAGDLMTRARVYRRVLDRYMLPLGFRANGTPNSQLDIPGDRSESTAVLDVAFLGLLTGLEAATPIRATGFSATAA